MCLKEQTVFGAMLYDTMHEADISKFINALDERLKNFYTQTALTRLRNAAGLSQSELAERSGVSIRIILPNLIVELDTTF